jgi:flagellum-specific peptidoglycan hydrolase FlgJ
MIMRKFTILLIISAFTVAVYVKVFPTAAGYKKYTLTQYVEAFKQTAISEMNRTGVPASITISQAILESGYGNSYLAVYANNHFGIKTKPDWNGEIFYVGKTCYKKYNTVLESYTDHSDHLKEHKWYNDLFALPITDYKQWAYGLKKAGYAEDPNYAYRLIQLIEMYKFNAWDSLYAPVMDSLSIDMQDTLVH